MSRIRHVDDRELVRACREGDEGAWAELVRRYARLVFSIPLSYGLSREDAADIAQLTFTFLVQDLDSPADVDQLGSWFATVSRRHTWRLLERNRRERPLKGQDLSETAALVGRGGTETLERWELVEWLDYGISRLDGRCREFAPRWPGSGTRPSKGPAYSAVGVSHLSSDGRATLSDRASE